MSVASHLGPWLLGTQKNNNGAVSTANAALGYNRNMGATSVGQSCTVTWSDAANSNAFVIPAGAIITNVAFYTAGITTASGNTTLAVYVNSTQIASGTVSTANAASAGALTFTAAAATTIANVGTTDVVIKYTLNGTTLSNGTGTLLVEYIVRNSDGSYNPTSYTA